LFEEKRTNEIDCRSQIIGTAGKLNVSFLFIGYSGRKGPKEYENL
jgi:hypothetical protein